MAASGTGSREAKRSHRYLRNEAGWVIGQADVFVQVKGRDPVPSNIRLGDQRRQHLKLAGAGGDDDGARAGLRDGLPDERRAVGRGPLAEFYLV